MSASKEQVVHEAKSMLESIGVTEELLRGAVKVSETTRRRFTLNHPVMIPYLAAWGEAVCFLRENLIVKGWARRDDGGIPTVYNAEKKIAIAVMTGDEGTGLNCGDLRSKNSKGASTVYVINQNAQQLDFEFDFSKSKTRNVNPENIVTWYLVIARSGNEIRFELSLPLALDGDQRIHEWKERIIFPALSLDDTPVVPNNEYEAKDIVVEVLKRI